MARPSGIIGFNPQDFREELEAGRKDFESEDLKNQSELQSNFLRIQANIEDLNDKEAPIEVVSRYLRTENSPIFLSERKKEDVNPASIGLAITRGAITGTATLAALPLLAVDALAFGVTSIFDENATKESFDSSGQVLRGALEINKIFNPNFSFAQGLEDVESSGVIRTAEKIGEFVAPGGILIKGISRKGAKLIAKSPEIQRWWHKIFIEVAKDPAKQQKIEAGLGAIAATAGELTATTISERGGTQQEAGYGRFAAEIFATVGSVMGASIVNRVLNFAKNSLTLTTAAREAAAERNFGLMLNELMEANPEILVQMAKAEKLTAATGVKFNLAEASQNPDLQATINALLNTATDTGQTKFLRMVEADRRLLNEFIIEVRPLLQNAGSPIFKQELTTFMAKKFEAIDAKVALLERKAVEEADLLHPRRSLSEIGEAGEKQMASLEDAAEGGANVLYNSLGSDLAFRTNHVQTGMNLAKLSPNIKTAQESARRIKAGGEAIGLKGKATNFEGFSDDIVDAFTHNFKDSPTTDLQKLRDFRKMVGQEERIARMRGERELANRYDIIRKSVDRQLKSVKDIQSKSAANTLTQANAAWTAKKLRFDKAYDRVGIQRDITGMYNFSPEDFGRLFIRQESRKSSVESAKRFKQIFGTDKNGKLLPSAKALIRDTVAYELNALQKTGAGELNIPLVQSWLRRHKQNLKSHGIWDEFKDAGKSAVRALEERTNAMVDRKLYNRSILQSIIGSDDVSKSVSKALDDGSITRLREELRSIKNTPAERGLAQELWDVVVNRSERGKLDTAETILRKPDELLLILQRHEKELRKGLGNGHFKNLQIIARTIKRKEGKIPTFGEGLIRIRGAANAEEEVAKGTAKIYAAARGFISPPFVVGSLARSGVHIINSRAARHIVEEAMYDWRYAKRLADAAKDSAGQQSMRALGVAMVPMSLDALNTDDERTEN